MLVKSYMRLKSKISRNPTIYIKGSHCGFHSPAILTLSEAALFPKTSSAKHIKDHGLTGFVEYYLLRNSDFFKTLNARNLGFAAVPIPASSKYLIEEFHVPKTQSTSLLWHTETMPWFPANPVPGLVEYPPQVPTLIKKGFYHIF